MDIKSSLLHAAWHHDRLAQLGSIMCRLRWPRYQQQGMPFSCLRVKVNYRFAVTVTECVANLPSNLPS